MPTPEKHSPSDMQQSKVDLLIELAMLDKLILLYHETALALDEQRKLDNLLEQRDWIKNELQQYQE